MYQKAMALDHLNSGKILEKIENLKKMME
jgi:hypothetical protein